MKVVSGDQLRFVTYPHPKSTMEDTSKQIRHYGDSDACVERLVMSIPNQVRLYCLYCAGGTRGVPSSTDNIMNRLGSLGVLN